MMKNKLMMKALPWLLMFFGFFTLNMFQGYLALTCMVISIVTLLERRWPEKWGDDSTIQ